MRRSVLIILCAVALTRGATICLCSGRVDEDANEAVLNTVRDTSETCHDDELNHEIQRPGEDINRSKRQALTATAEKLEPPKSVNLTTNVTVAVEKADTNKTVGDTNKSEANATPSKGLTEIKTEKNITTSGSAGLEITPATTVGIVGGLLLGHALGGSTGGGSSSSGGANFTTKVGEGAYF